MPEPLALESAVDELRRSVAGVQAIYLFGSQAGAAARADSDVDLAVLAAAPLDPLERWKLAERLAALLHCDVDLVDLRRASTVLRVQVVAAERVLFDGDPTARAYFEAYALSDYARLNEARKGILQDVRERGTIHG